MGRPVAASTGNRAVAGGGGPIDGGGGLTNAAGTVLCPTSGTNVLGRDSQLDCDQVESFAVDDQEVPLH